MINPDNYLADDAEQIAKEHHEYAGFTARHLMKKLRILPGNKLTPIIGIGFERNNLEALESWVYFISYQLKIPFSKDQFEMLEVILQGIIEAAESDFHLQLRMKVSGYGK
jgi:hypothetical protein